MSTEFSKILAGLPDLGVGLGLRRELHEATLQSGDDLHWLEFTPEEFMGTNGKAMQRLEEAASIFPLISHGINLSLGSTDELNRGYLAALKELLDIFDVPWWSDHISFSSANGIYVNNLLPLPRNMETVNLISKRVRIAQDFIERPALVENISFYMPNPPGSEMSEAEFISEILEKADCGFLLDLNNVYVNSVNHRFDPFEFLCKIPLERVVQVHLAGHNYHEGSIIDTHSEAVCDPVYEMLDFVLRKVRPKGIMVERDGNFPDFSEIKSELRRIEAIVDRSSQLQILADAAEKQENSRSQTASISIKPIVLSELQSVFSQVVVDKYARRKVLNCLTEGCDCNGTGGFEKRHADELDLYARITEAGALSAMKMMYPVSRKLLGEDKWDETINLYFHTCQPTGYILAFIGEKYPQFLASIQDRLAFPFVADMADFEWQSIYAIESGAFLVSEIQSLEFSLKANPAEMKPVLNPTLTLRKYNYSISKIFDQLSGTNITEIDFGEPENVVFFRTPDQNQVHVFQLEEQLALILEEIPKCNSYASLYKNLLAREGAAKPVQQIVEYAKAIEKLFNWKLILGDQNVAAVR